LFFRLTVAKNKQKAGHFNFFSDVSSKMVLPVFIIPAEYFYGIIVASQALHRQTNRQLQLSL